MKHGKIALVVLTVLMSFSCRGMNQKYTKGNLVELPAEQTDSFSFIAFGDTRQNAWGESLTGRVNSDKARREMAREIRQRHLDGDSLFAVLIGDAVLSGSWRDEWKGFYKRFFGKPGAGGAFRMYAVAGGHEYKQGGKGMDNFRAFFNFPGSECPNPDSRQRWYSFRYGNSAFIMLDSQGTYLDRGCRDNQYAFIDTCVSLYSSDPAIRHLFVFTHVPPITNASVHGNSTFSQRLYRLVRTADINRKLRIFFTSHNHFAEVYRMPGGELEVVTGGGGAPLDYLDMNRIKPGDIPLEPEFEALLNRYDADRNRVVTSKELKFFHYCMVRVEGDQVEFQLRAWPEFSDTFYRLPVYPVEEAAALAGLPVPEWYTTGS
ncbi:hypothetical protein JW905_04635 [bacterium]|nr:hypothetical protein [candidate division CSSED10-310 bacterium]